MEVKNLTSNTSVILAFPAASETVTIFVNFLMVRFSYWCKQPLKQPLSFVKIW